MSANVWNETPSGTKNGVNLTFTLAYTPVTGSLDLYQNTSRLNATQHYSLSGTTITFIDPPLASDVLIANYETDDISNDVGDASDLISLAEARNYPGMPASGEADLIRALISACSLALEESCETAFIRRVFTEDYAHEYLIRRPDRDNYIQLRRYPIYSVTSITNPAGNTIAATDYWIDKPHGRLVCAGVWDVPQDSNGFVTYWTIVYTAGRYAASANVPANLKMACKMMVASLYGRPDRDVVSKSVGDLSLNYAQDRRAIAALVSPYRSISV